MAVKRTSVDEPYPEQPPPFEEAQLPEGVDPRSALASAPLIDSLPDNYSGPIPPLRDPDKEWQDYVVLAINGLYPYMRNGVDFSWGRRDIKSDPEMLGWDDEKFAPPDLGKIEEAARRLADAHPYGAKYTALPPLAPAQQRFDAGEVPTRRY
jgi:hypothetical protein